ncbi:MAG: hypothetical protein OXE95_14345 [Chloroflexi bacterium]|nr:hypothetical protein [Chloroflexota bacterium]MCY4248748.1 hypothetical protein [Chloroflexota bacterium]
MAQSLRLLYTGHIGGDLWLLPRLHTFLRRLMLGADNCLLLDTGAACSEQVWHCRATGGRSCLVALDGLGYHAANVADELTAGQRDKLARQVSVGLVDATHDWGAPGGEILVALEPRTAPHRLQICLRSAERTRLAGKALWLGKVGAGQVGEARLEMGASPRITHVAVHDMSRGTPPNPGIAGLVEFIESEARRVNPGSELG